MSSSRKISRKEYVEALERLEEIFDASPGTKEGKELEALCILIESFENKHFPIFTNGNKSKQ